MGYTVSTKFKSEKACAKMLDFLTDNKKLVAQILATDCHHDFIGEGSDLAYAPKLKTKVFLGFNSTRTTFSQWAMCAWMSFKEGAKSHGQCYVYYDTEKSLINVNKKQANGLNVDEMGILLGEKEIHNGVDIDAIMNPNREQTQKLLRELAQRYEIILNQEFLSDAISKKNSVKKINCDKDKITAKPSKLKI